MKRRHLLKFNKEATVYINLLCEKIVEDFVKYCELTVTSKKSCEKTFGWK